MNEILTQSDRPNGIVSERRFLIAFRVSLIRYIEGSLKNFIQPDTKIFRCLLRKHDKTTPTLSHHRKIYMPLTHHSRDGELSVLVPHESFRC